MALDNYSDLQASIADWLHRTDLTDQIKDFIRLAEADMQVRAKLSQWDTSASVAFTSGVGSLPSDFAHAISLAYSTDTYTLSFNQGEQFDNYAAAAGDGTPLYWTIRGSQILLAPTATGTGMLKYTARFTPLSGSATTNSLLALFPDAYLTGSLMHACSWTVDTENMAKFAGLFEAAIKRIRTYMFDFKYPHGLQMRAA